MTTWIDLMRVAKHMRERCLAISTDRVLSRAYYEAAEMLECEARRIQADEWLRTQEANKTTEG